MESLECWVDTYEYELFEVSAHKTNLAFLTCLYKIDIEWFEKVSAKK